LSLIITEKLTVPPEHRNWIKQDVMEGENDIMAPERRKAGSGRFILVLSSPVCTKT